jgi:hypothetical protein
LQRSAALRSSSALDNVAHPDHTIVAADNAPPGSATRLRPQILPASVGRCRNDGRQCPHGT